MNYGHSESTGNFEEAQTVLNDARKKIPTSPLIWVTAVKLQEKAGKLELVTKLLERAIESLSHNGVETDREMWLTHAEEAEKLHYPQIVAALSASPLALFSVLLSSALRTT